MCVGINKFDKGMDDDKKKIVGISIGNCSLWVWISKFTFGE